MDEIAITDTESRYFGDLFLCCDVEKTGKIPVLKATELFRSANLSNDVIRQITSLSGVQQTALHISRSQFYSCLKLIAAFQASIPLRTEVITSTTINMPLPRFSWKDSPPLNRQASTSVTINPGAVASAVITIAGAGSASGPIGAETNGLVTTTNSSREVYHSPDLIELARVRDLQNDTTNSDLQSTDSEVEHNESGSGRVNRRHRGGSPEAWSTNSDSPTPTNSVAERPWAKDNLWQGLLGDEHRQLLGTEEESSDRHSSEDDNETDLESIYQITSEQREYYNKQFKAVQPDPNGLLSGHIARVFFEKSRIPVEELRHIWQLCDVTRDGALSLAEFTAAMHLVVLRRNNIPLPPVLPPCLNPNVLNQSAQQAAIVEPPEADLLHLDDDKTDAVSIKSTTNENDYKRMISVHPEKSNVMNLSTLSTTSQTSVSSKQNTKNSSSPVSVGGHSKNRSASSSPPADPATPPNHPRGKELIKDWTNQSREWTKFTESPTSNVSSPKPVNFDMQRTAQAVVSDPQILHPVPLRVTPVGGTEILDDETTRILRKSETLVYEGSGLVVLRENETSPKQNASAQLTTTATSHSQQHRDSLPGNDLRAIQRPQPKKIPTKSVGAIPPPPQREPSVGSGSIDAIEMNCSGSGNGGGPSSLAPTGLISKKEPPPLPPPRPHRHARSSSLDLNKLKMGGTGTGGPVTQDITSQNSFDVQDSSNSGFADFAHFPDFPETLKVAAIDVLSQNSVGDSAHNVAPPPRPIIASLQTSQRVSAFEVYRKPNTPRNSQSPDSLQIIQQPYPQIPSTNSSSTVSIISGTEYEKRVAAISETLRHVSFKHDKNVLEVLRHLREQNVLLLRLCNDLSEELLTVQQRKEEMRSKLENAGSSNLSVSTTATGNGNISTNITGGSGSSGGVQSNV